MLELLELERPRNPAAVDDMMGGRSVGGDGPKAGQKLSRDRKQHDRDNQCVGMSTRSEIDEG